ncbi:MAG TPA: hypothetical protein VGG42_09030 [Acidobacteriaceae bacterium]
MIAAAPAAAHGFFEGRGGDEGGDVDGRGDELFLHLTHVPLA